MKWSNPIRRADRVVSIALSLTVLANSGEQHFARPYATATRWTMNCR